MSPQDMIDSFSLNYAAEINLSVPGWEDSDILEFLNKSQDNLTRELYISSLDSNLRELVKSQTLGALSSYGSVIPNAKKVEITSLINDYLYYLLSQSQIERTDPSTSSSEWVENKIIEGKYAPKFTETLFNKPWFKSPVVFFEEDYLVVIYDSYTTALTNIELKYIKIPERIALSPLQSCELNNDFHQKVVDRAVMYALETLESNRIKTQPIINQ